MTFRNYIKKILAASWVIKAWWKYNDASKFGNYDYSYLNYESLVYEYNHVLSENAQLKKALSRGVETNLELSADIVELNLVLTIKRNKNKVLQGRIDSALKKIHKIKSAYGRLNKAINQ